MRRGLSARLRESLAGFRSLLTFLTIIPAGGEFNLAPRHFYWTPLIGLIEGLLSTPPLLISRPIGVALAVALMYIINGFQHMDGFLDFGEVLLTGRRGAEAVRVLKDPHRGAFALALGLIDLVLVYSSVSSMGKAAMVTLPIAESSAAYAMFMTAHLGKPGESGVGKLFVMGSKGGVNLALSTIIYLVSTAAVPPMYHWDLLILILLVPVSLLTAIVVALLVTRLSNLRLGFVNGDVLGFSFESSKVTLLVIYSIMIYAASLG
jgi:adenosylcobinamide-GDP ribazoletransferase